MATETKIPAGDEGGSLCPSQRIKKSSEGLYSNQDSPFISFAQWDVPFHLVENSNQSHLETMKSTTKSSKETSTGKLLGQLLADTYALLGQTQFAHWNVQGPAFFSLHTFLETQYEEIFQAVDVIAERLRALDEISPGGLKTLASLSGITELEVKAHPAKDLVSHLLGCHEIVVKTAMKVRDHAGNNDDAETEDLAIGRLRVHEKTMWMLRAFLKNP